MIKKLSKRGEWIMSKKVISTKNAPAAIGPYSQGIVACGETCYVSGQIPLDPATGEFAGDDIKSQTRQSLTNIKAILAEAGMTMENVVKTTVLLSDIANFVPMNEVYAEFFEGDCPARAAFQAAALPKGALVEIEAIAVK
jgi:2-iminobutanoate/2-iminopropanoate deaminase